MPPFHSPLLSTLQLPLLLLTNILTLALLAPTHRTLPALLLTPLPFLLALQSLSNPPASPWGNVYAANCGVMSLLATWLDWVVLRGPDREGWVKLARREDARGKDGGEGGFGKRAWWAVRLACTTRYVGWSSEVKGVRVEVDGRYPRWRFVLRKSARAALFYLLKDAVYAYTAASPHGSWVDIEAVKPATGYAEYPFWHRFWYVWMYIVLTYVSLELYNTVVGVVSVACGLARPEECPSAFGDLKGLWSVRRAWSLVWHQQCRRVCSAPGVFVVRDVLRLRKGSFASKYLQLFIGFGVSGLVHGGASMLCHGSLNDDGAMKVFLAQAVIILLEDHLIVLGKRVGFEESGFWHVVGFFWTVFAVGASMESWAGSLLQHGIWVHDREVDWFGIGPKV